MFFPKVFQFFEYILKKNQLFYTIKKTSSTLCSVSNIQKKLNSLTHNYNQERFHSLSHIQNEKKGHFYYSYKKMNSISHIFQKGINSLSHIREKVFNSLSHKREKSVQFFESYEKKKVSIL